MGAGDGQLLLERRVPELYQRMTRLERSYAAGLCSRQLLWEQKKSIDHEAAEEASVRSALIWYPIGLGVVMCGIQVLAGAILLAAWQSDTQNHVLLAALICDLVVLVVPATWMVLRVIQVRRFL